MVASGMKRSGSMWVRAEDTFMPRYFDVTGDAFEIDHLTAALAHCSGRGVALDVDAHYGSWSRHLGRQFAQVNAYEPVPETFACLVENTRDFPNVQIFQQAVGEKNQRVSVGQGKIYQHPGTETVTTSVGDIDMVRIDDLGLPLIDFIKIDVEGYELHVLHGAEQTLRRDKPVIIFEENNRGQIEHNIQNGRCASFLNALGAELMCVLNKDFVFKWPC
jgi:FkbM family methyltransferase